MQKSLSVYLDFIRIVAAFAVFATHANHFVFPHFKYLAIHGGEAVALFFVLSGFLITFAATTRETSAAEYFTARCARIYPVLIAALIVTPLVDNIGLTFSPENYIGKSYFDGSYLQNGVSIIVFLNEIWSSHAIFGSNEPLWSLGFEVPYYVLLGLFLFVKGPFKLVALVAAATLFGPKILMYLPLWLIGCWTYLATQNSNFLKRKSLWYFIPFVGSILSYMVLRQKYSSPGMQQYIEDDDLLRTWLYFVVVAGLASLNILSFFALPIANISVRLAAVVRWVAGGTFTLYLLHQPLLLAFSSIVPAKQSLIWGLAEMASVIAICYCVAEAVERPKLFYRRLISGWISRPRIA